MSPLRDQGSMFANRCPRGGCGVRVMNERGALLAEHHGAVVLGEVMCRDGRRSRGIQNEPTFELISTGPEFMSLLHDRGAPREARTATGGAGAPGSCSSSGGIPGDPNAGLVCLSGA